MKPLTNIVKFITSVLVIYAVGRGQSCYIVKMYKILE